MLTILKICEKCRESNCEVLYFDKIRKEWYCSSCSDYLRKAESPTPQKLTHSRGVLASN